MDALSKNGRLGLLQLLTGIWEQLERLNRNLESQERDQKMTLAVSPAPDSYIAESRRREGRCLECGVPDSPENRSSNQCRQASGSEAILGHVWPEDEPQFRVSSPPYNPPSEEEIAEALGEKVARCQRCGLKRTPSSKDSPCQVPTGVNEVTVAPRHAWPDDDECGK